jgi:deoxyribonuclease V
VEYHCHFQWPETKADAIAIQAEISQKILIQKKFDDPQLIAAVDIDYGFRGELLYAAAVVLSFPQFEEIEKAVHVERVTFPYTPGLFFFREGPVIVEVLKKIQSKVDLIMIGGHGIAHPKQCGLACHVGVGFDIPTIGCARKLLCGQHQPVGEPKGSSQVIMNHGQQIGIALRSKNGVKPIYLSPGHKCDLDYTHNITKLCLRTFRLPEPLRIAHLYANKFRQHSEKKTTELTPPVNC